MWRQISTFLLYIGMGCILAIVFLLFGMMLAAMVAGFAIRVDPAGASGSFASAAQLPVIIVGTLLWEGGPYLALIGIASSILGLLIRDNLG